MKQNVMTTEQTVLSKSSNNGKRRKSILGWIAVGVTVLISGVWAYWGAVENFHEGWYAASFWENALMLVFQYLIFAIVFVVLALVSLRWKKAGLVLHIIAALFSAWFFWGAGFFVLFVMIVMPILGLGLMYYFGEPSHKAWAYRIIILVPLCIVLAISIPKGIQVSNRLNDGDTGARTVEGNGVCLVWAPRGPGWPDEGVSYEVALEICKYLSEDGTTIMDEEQNIWRLPTADEAVRSMMLHGENAGGVWYPDKETAVYEMTPDKESPLWNVYSKVIYYWTADAADETQAYMIVYHGGVYQRDKTSAPAYLSFRAVKDVDNQ